MTTAEFSRALAFIDDDLIEESAKLPAAAARSVRRWMKPAAIAAGLVVVLGAMAIAALSQTSRAHSFEYSGQISGVAWGLTAATAGSSAAASTPPDMGGAADTASYAASSAAAASEISGGYGAGASSGTSAAVDSGRKIVKSADIALATTAYGTTTGSIDALISKYGGYIQSSSAQGGNDTGSARSASYTVRVPSASLSGFLNEVAATGTVLKRSETGEDVTQNYYDTQSRLNALKIERASLEAMLAKATDTAGMLNIYNTLADVNTQIEQMTGALQQMNSLAALSTVTVSVAEVQKTPAKPATGFWAKIGDTLSASWQTFVGSAKALVLALAAALPFLLGLGLVVVIVVIVRRRGRRRKM